MRPTLFSIGPVAVRAYGVMIVLAFIAGTTWAIREARRRGLPPERMVDAALAALIGGLIGARLLYVALDPVLTWRDLPYVWRGGLSYHGGLLGGIAAAMLYLRLVRLQFGAMLDSAAPGLALGYAIARIGCFLNGCCYGSPTSLPWGVRFPDEKLGGLTPPSHPAQLYSSAASLVVFGLLLALRTRVRTGGQLFMAYLALYGGQRYLIEIFRRGYTATILWGPLTKAQVASIGMIGLGLAGWWGLRAAGARRDATGR